MNELRVSKVTLNIEIKVIENDYRLYHLKKTLRKSLLLFIITSPFTYILSVKHI